MTAEIAIMNKNAVALAADSAVTIGNGERLKIYSTNKLFMLSKYHPVGMMIYGNAELLGVSWETSIKAHRQELGDRVFPTLEEYASSFINFIENNRKLYPKDAQDSWAHDKVLSGLRFIKHDIDDEVEKVIHNRRQISESELKIIITESIQSAYENVMSKDNLSLADDSIRQFIDTEYDDFIREKIGQVFQKLPLSRTLVKKIKEICKNLLLKDLTVGDQAGLVVAGFGNDEHFPSLIEYEIDGILFNRLKYKIARRDSISRIGRASVMPFAQSEMVHTFMEGIDPHIYAALNSYLEKLMGEIYPEQIVSSLPASKLIDKDALKSKLTKVGENLLSALMTAINKHKWEQNINPVLDAVEFLPKEELAAMAESLVNLTSFKRRVTLDAETVGGPIDVAVISKGDGFIWVKRKHYFEAEMNPQFRSNYYR